MWKCTNLLCSCFLSVSVHPCVAKESLLCGSANGIAECMASLGIALPVGDAE